MAFDSLLEASKTHPRSVTIRNGLEENGIAGDFFPIDLCKCEKLLNSGRFHGSNLHLLESSDSKWPEET